MIYKGCARFTLRHLLAVEDAMNCESTRSFLVNVEVFMDSQGHLPLPPRS